jgi:hypothetical protein
LCEPSEKREEIRFADLTGADNIFFRMLFQRKRRKRLGEGRGGEEEGDERETSVC